MLEVLLDLVDDEVVDVVFDGRLVVLVLDFQKRYRPRFRL